MRKQEPDNPLPGYVDEYWTDANYLVFRDHYVLMLRVYHGKMAADLVNDIERDGLNAPYCDSRVFSLNEMAFEIRAAKSKGDLSQEDDIRDEWIKVVINQSGEDAGLDFLSFLVESRRGRDNRFFSDFKRHEFGYRE
jgi:hypothetical protein